MSGTPGQLVGGIEKGQVANESRIEKPALFAVRSKIQEVRSVVENCDAMNG